MMVEKAREGLPVWDAILPPSGAAGAAPWELKLRHLLLRILLLRAERDLSPREAHDYISFLVIALQSTEHELVRKVRAPLACAATVHAHST